MGNRRTGGELKLYPYNIDKLVFFYYTYNNYQVLTEYHLFLHNLPDDFMTEREIEEDILARLVGNIPSSSYPLAEIDAYPLSHPVFADAFEVSTSSSGAKVPATLSFISA